MTPRSTSCMLRCVPRDALHRISCVAVDLDAVYRDISCSFAGAAPPDPSSTHKSGSPAWISFVWSLSLSLSPSSGGLSDPLAFSTLAALSCAVSELVREVEVDVVAV